MMRGAEVVLLLQGHVSLLHGVDLLSDKLHLIDLCLDYEGC